MRTWSCFNLLNSLVSHKLLWCVYLPYLLVQIPTSNAQEKLPIDHAQTDRLQSKSCLQLKQLLQQDELTIQAEYRLLNLKQEQIQKRLILPKAPQLRGRIDSNIGVSELSNRIGIRWHLPRFAGLFADQSLAASFKLWGLEQNDLPQYWLKLKKRAFLLSLFQESIAIKEAQINLIALETQVRLMQVQIELSRQLLNDGLIHALSHKSLELELQHQQLKLDQTRNEFDRMRIRSRLAQPIPKPFTCLKKGIYEYLASAIEKQTYTKDSTSPSSITDVSAQSPLGLKELELLMQIFLAKQESKLKKHQWIEFLELSYDTRVGSDRVIAELGMNLPLGVQAHEEPKAESEHFVQQFTSLRNRTQEQRRLIAIHLKKLLKADGLSFLKLSDQTPQELPNLPKLSTLEHIKLAQTQSYVWQGRWRSRLSQQRSLLDYFAYHVEIAFELN